MASSHTTCHTRVKARTVRDHFWKRQGIKSVLWVLLPLVLMAGWFYPILGFTILACMGASVGLSFRYGRTWCDFCPRGTFFDMVMPKISAGRAVPRFLRSTPWRVFMLMFLMGMMTFQLMHAWGNVAAMGRVFWTLLMVTTGVGVILAVPFQSRTWCAFCPMGSMASWIGKGRRPLYLEADKCTSCGLCTKVCPMELNPAGMKDEGVLTHGDCLKCSKCVVACTKGALCFDGTEHIPRAKPARESVAAG